MHRRGPVLICAFFMSLIWFACDGKGGSSVYDPGDTGGMGGSGTGGMDDMGKGVGEDCADDAECRSGLICDGGTCQPGHNKEEGADCVISAECEDGLFCADGVCAPAGSGMDGDACQTDADCASGFRCAIQGFNTVCVPEGNVDVGGECALSTDCFGGLACVDGTCQQPLPGIPPFGSPWPGVPCPDPSTGSVEAYFRVPRPGDDNDFFQLPFPNDVRFDAVNGVNLSGFPTPGDQWLGFDPVQPYVDAIEASADGWGVYQSVFFRYSGRIDSSTMQQSGAVRLVDLTTSQGLGLYWSYSQGRSNYICHNRVIIRRSHGRTFEPGHTYAAYMTNLVKDENGGDIVRPGDLVALLGSTMPTDANVAPHWADYAAFRQYLTDNTIDPAMIVNASVFRVGNPRRVVEQLQGVIDGQGAPGANAWTLCDTGVPSPCPDATGSRQCEAADPDYHELHALVSLPIFQKGTAPYQNPGDGGDLDESGGAPVQVRTEPVCMSLTIPKDTMPGTGWPTVVFAHGTNGHFRDHVTNGIAKSWAQGVDDGTGTIVKAAVLGIDQVQHGPRRNGSMEDPSDLFFNYINPDAAKGNPQQGAADQMALLRFAQTLDFTTGSPTGTSFNLSGDVAFWGHSQGGTHGGIALPYGDWMGAVFTGHGAGLKHSLVTKRNPIDIAGSLPLVLQDWDAMFNLPYGANHPITELLQLFMDAGDPIAYGRITTVDPPATLEAKHVFHVYGQADTYSPTDTQSAYAVNAALGMVQHHSSVTTVEPIGGQTVNDEIPLPASGNLNINAKVVSAYVREFAPSGMADGHFVAFDIIEANDDALRFLAGALSGITPIVGQ